VKQERRPVATGENGEGRGHRKGPERVGVVDYARSRSSDNLDYQKTNWQVFTG